MLGPGDGEMTTVGAYPIIKMAAVAAVTVLLNAGCFVAVGSTGGGAPPFPGGGFRRKAAPTNTAEANGVVQRSLQDVERYWAQTYPALAGGDAFQPVRGGYHPYTQRDLPPPCGRQAVDYQPNAFYCPDGDFIAWDAQQLIPELNADFGPLLVGVVFAHEYGHAIQTRLGRSRQPTIVMEQQADCFAGSWVADVLAGNSDVFRDIKAEQLDSTVAGLLQLRDQPGTSAMAPQAHGNAFDRVRAFQEGVELKADRCATYRSDNLPVTEIEFDDPTDEANGGNLPSYDDAVDQLSRDVQAYWQRTFPQLTGQQWQPLQVNAFDPADPPACEGRDQNGGETTAFYCPSGSYVAFDGVQLGPTLYQRIGDNALGMLLGNLFAQAVQERRGKSTDGRDGQLAVDCLAGSWTHDLLHRTEQDPIRLSPGDLDEAVIALLVFGRAQQSGGASAFDRISGFRKGVLQGLPACG